ncbi:GTP cyclohydrolase I [Micromonospora chersina]|uniref:GTP cyclohydrolase I n=1 Tax=Micromonospora chersina TaxID=47854 RepID=UPI003F53EC61
MRERNEVPAARRAVAAGHRPGGGGAGREAFLEAIGVSTSSENLRDTPRRMVEAYREMFSPRPFDLTTFHNDEGYDALVLARRIPLRPGN